MILEEYAPDIIHIKGEENAVADALSRLSRGEQEDNKSSIKHELFAQNEEEEVDAFPISYTQIAEETANEIKQASSKLKDLLSNKESGYYKYNLEVNEVVMHKKCT